MIEERLEIQVIRPKAVHERTPAKLCIGAVLMFVAILMTTPGFMMFGKLVYPVYASLCPELYTLDRLYAEKAPGVVRLLLEERIPVTDEEGKKGYQIETIGGSGFFIRPNYIVTNAHVAKKVGREVLITTMLGTTKGEVIVSDLNEDLALVYTKDPYPVVLSFAKEDPEVGDIIFNIGSNPSRFNTPHVGQVKSLLGFFERYPGAYSKNGIISTDIETYGGQSGSPIFNTRGEVVGVIAQQANNFGIAINTRSYVYQFAVDIALHKMLIAIEDTQVKQVGKANAGK